MWREILSLVYVQIRFISAGEQFENHIVGLKKEIHF